jgi:hypothetical protein
MLITIILGLALLILGYVLMPRPPEPKQSIQELESPTAEAGRIVPFLFGDKTIDAPNFLGWWDKQYRHKEDDSGSKK